MSGHRTAVRRLLVVAWAACWYGAAWFITEDRALWAAVLSAAAMYAFCLWILTLIAKQGEGSSLGTPEGKPQEGNPEQSAI